MSESWSGNSYFFLTYFFHFRLYNLFYLLSPTRELWALVTWELRPPNSSLFDSVLWTIKTWYSVLACKAKWTGCFISVHWMEWRRCFHRRRGTLFHSTCPVSWSCRIHWLHLCHGVRPHHPNECPGYDTKHSDGKAPVMLELWRMRSIPSLPLLLGSLWPGIVAPDRVLSMGQIKLFDI